MSSVNISSPELDGMETEKNFEIYFEDEWKSERGLEISNNFLIHQPSEVQKKNASSEKIQTKNTYENIAKKVMNMLRSKNNSEKDLSVRKVLNELIKREEKESFGEFTFETVKSISSANRFAIKSKKKLLNVWTAGFSQDISKDKAFKRIICDIFLYLLQPHNIENYVMNSSQLIKNYLWKKGISMEKINEAYQQESIGISKEFRKLREELC